MQKQKISTRDLCYIGIFTAIIVGLAQISIPMPYGVPMTMQTFAIPLAGIVLGAKRGTLVAVVYVLLGAMSVPVFAGFSGGLGIVLGPTGGFILSFPIMAFTAGIGAEKGSRIWLAFWLVAGAVINYLCGMIMFSVVMASDMKTAFIACVLPFIPTAIIKIVLSGVLGVKLKSVLDKMVPAM